MNSNPYVTKVELGVELDKQNQKIDLKVNNLELGVNGSIDTTTDTTSLPDGVYRTQISGTYTNAGNIIVKEGYYTLLRKEGGVWKLESEVEMPTLLPTGKVEEGNTEAVSGGEVYKKYGDITYFTVKGKYTSVENSTIVNVELETTDYIDVSNFDYISGYGRGTASAPTIIYFNEQNNIAGTYVGSSAGASFNILKSDFPSGAVKIKINSLLNRGVFNKGYLQELNDRISAPKKIKLKEKIGVYVNISGVEVTESAYKSTQLFPIDVDNVVNIYNASTNGIGAKPVIFFNNKKEPIGYINATTFNNTYNIELNGENIPSGARFIRINAILNNNIYITTNTDILLADLSTKEVDISNLVEKESGKGLYPYNDANKVGKLNINGSGTKILFDDGDYKEISLSGDIVIENKYNMDEVISNTIVSSKIQTKKPKVVLTFDDGRLTDYTHVKPVLDEYGVKGVFYVNDFDLTNKMTTPMIQELYNNGHEIGSHTLNHRILSAVAVLAPITATDTVLKVAAPYGDTGYLGLNSGEIMQMYAIFGTDRVEVNVINSWFESGNWWLELDEPIGRDMATNIEFFITEKTAVFQAKYIKDKLNNIGVQCHGFAYPYGGTNDANKIAMQSIFSYARRAFGDNNQFRIFGGIDTYKYNDFFDQFALPSIEIPNLTYTQIDTHITNVIANGGVLCFLGHSTNSYSYDMYPKLRYIIEKCQSLGIEITTMHDALQTHGNVMNNGYSNVNSEGLSFNNGFTVLQPNSLANLESTHNYPIGLSTQRVYNGQTIGYPEVGTIIRVNSGHKNSEKSFWTCDYFIGLESGYIYHRKRNGTFTATEWECLSTRKGTVFPTTILTVGCSFYRTDLKKMCYYDGNSWRDAIGNII